jgi:predicted aminopeptidase
MRQRLAPVAERLRFLPLVAFAALLTASGLLGGCATLGYYAQSISGHLELMSLRESVDGLISDDGTPQDLRARLETATEIREFAHLALDLPDNGSYRSYVSLDRPYVSWTVVAAPELSLRPKTWCFPVAGCVAYRGYFEETAARQFATTLQAQGYDVHVAGVQAYSTLGWFDDPLLNTMISQPDYRLAGVIFHELAHQRLYVPGDSSFNEAYANLMEREGVSRWLARSADSDLKARYRIYLERRAEFLDLVARARKSLETAYASDGTEVEKRAAKSQAFAHMREEDRTLRAQWNGFEGYDAWFESGLNNAKIALVLTYNEHLPALQNLLANKSGDLRAFNAACEALARLPAGERNTTLNRLAAS